MRDIKYRFPCGDSGLSEIIKKGQNVMTRVLVSPPHFLHDFEGKYLSRYILLADRISCLIAFTSRFVGLCVL